MPFDGAIDEVAEVLERVRKRLSAPNAWCRGDFRKGDAHCLLGALFMEKCGEVPLRNEATLGYVSDASFAPLMPYISALGFADYDWLAVWNDKRWRTLEQVINRLDRAILKRRARDAV